jgi:hypothetical protein
MPYAAKAVITHNYITGHLEVYATFHLRMKQIYKLPDDPVEYPCIPPLNKWQLKADTVIYDITASIWLDEHTLKLTSENIALPPSLVTLAYLGPNQYLKTAWEKQWEPWGAIVSSAVGSTTFASGMIILWHGAINTIPAGWVLCNGSNGTPDLRDKFVIGAGATYSPGGTGGTETHNHFMNITTGENSNYYTVDLGSEQDVAGDQHTHDISTSTENAGTLPPFYALAYIMKL